MPYTMLHRKAALVGMGVKRLDIAKACKVDPSLVTHVIAGRRLGGPQARRVMEYLAKLFGAPIEEVFPGCDRRGGTDRRRKPRAPFDQGEPYTPAA